MTAVGERDAQITELEARLGETERIQASLIDAEQRAAAVPQLTLRIAELEAALAQARKEGHEARLEARALDERLMESSQVLVDVMSSPSWRVTKPLRRAKQLLR